jgi:hypothetical protein
MMKQVKNLRERVSDKLLIGAITLEGLLGNPSLAFAQESGETATSSPNYVLGATGIVLGSFLCYRGRELEDRGHEMSANILTYAGFFIWGAVVGHYI